MDRIQWKFLTLLFAVLQLFFFVEVLVNAEPMSSAFGEAKRSLEPENQDLKKRQSGFYPVLGAQSSGRCFPRRNIEDLRRRYPDEFNMLLLALDEVQMFGAAGDLSWFGVGGIHGAPYISWQQPPEEGPFNTNLGYGVHSNPLFTLWHRPYVLLLEQLVQWRARAIAARFESTVRGRYLVAADRLRLPYMDWSDIAYEGRIPSFIMSRVISVTRPSGLNGTPQMVTTRNPLYRYNFQTSERSQLPGIWGNYWYTTRAPEALSPRPISRDDLVDLAMRNTFIPRHQNTFNLFTRTNFNAFSSQLEAIHNSIHVMMGSSVGTGNPMEAPGHMGSFVAAAFDPIFWLHHVNVDRLTAMYQVLYPNSRATPAPARATFGRVVPGKDGPIDDLDTNLYPFRKADGTFYKGRDFVSGRTGLWRYHYSYPEISCDASIPRPQVVSNVRQAINTLYGPVSESPIRRRQNETLPEPPPEEPIPGEESGYAPTGSEIGMVRTEYSLRLFIDLAEMVGLWTCHIFLGAVPSSPADYSTSPNRCGVFAPFSAEGETMESMAYTYDFALTDKLLSLGVSPNGTERYLTDNLKYVILSETGVIIDPSSLKTFTAGICSTEGTYGKPGSDRLASFGDCTVLYKITEDQPGGVTSPDELYEPTLLDGTPADLNATLAQF